MKKSATGWVLTLVLGVGGLQSLALTVDKNSELGRVSLALHQDTGRDIYLGALYFDKSQPAPEDYLLADAPRVMEYRVVARRTSIRSLLGNMLLQGELASGKAAPEDVQSLAADVMAAVQGSLYAGDSLEVELSREGNTRLWLNGQQLAAVEGRGAADFFMMGWSGERGPTTSFREQIGSAKIDAALLSRYEQASLTDQRVAEVEAWFEPEVEAWFEPEPEAEPEPVLELAPAIEPSPEAELIAASVTIIDSAPAGILDESIEESAAKSAGVSLESSQTEVDNAGVDGSRERVEESQESVEGSQELVDAIAIATVTDVQTEATEIAPTESEPLLVEQPDNDPIQVALAQPAPVLAELEAEPDPIAALDAVVYSKRLAQFNNMLLRKVYANISYPRAAVRRNLQGKLEIDLTMNRSGELLDYSVARSSGHSVLDEAALRAARNALRKPLTEIDPVAVAEYGEGGDRLIVPVPIAFILQE
ncbi:MAG: TonB family protein [Pseudomonadota bacterium]